MPDPDYRGRNAGRVAVNDARSYYDRLASGTPGAPRSGPQYADVGGGYEGSAREGNLGTGTNPADYAPGGGGGGANIGMGNLSSTRRNQYAVGGVLPAGAGAVQGARNFSALQQTNPQYAPMLQQMGFAPQVGYAGPTGYNDPRFVRNADGSINYNESPGTVIDRNNPAYAQFFHGSGGGGGGAGPNPSGVYPSPGIPGGASGGSMPTLTPFQAQRQIGSVGAVTPGQFQMPRIALGQGQGGGITGAMSQPGPQGANVSSGFDPMDPYSVSRAQEQDRQAGIDTLRQFQQGVGGSALGRGIEGYATGLLGPEDQFSQQLGAAGQGVLEKNNPLDRLTQALAVSSIREGRDPLAGATEQAAQNLIANPESINDEVQRQMEARAIEQGAGRTRDQERQLREDLGASGMLGTGAGMGQLAEVRRRGGEGVSNALRDIMLQRAMQGRQERQGALESVAGVGRGLTGQRLAGAAQGMAGQEALNRSGQIDINRYLAALQGNTGLIGNRLAKLGAASGALGGLAGIGGATASKIADIFNTTERPGSDLQRLIFQALLGAGGGYGQ